MHGVVEYDLANIRGPLTNAFIILINALFFNIKLIGLQDIYPKDYSDFLLKEYEDVFDFIIVGAGSAGCSLANRLTENEQWSVLLVEAGDYPSTTSEVPALFPTLAGTKEDWHYYLEKDDHACKSYFLQRCVVSRGKVLGGTSSINDLLYIRGLTEDYDSNAFESWGSNITYTIFKKLEDYKGSTEFNINYGSDGFIKLEHTNYTGPAKDFLKKAYRSMGLEMLSSKNFLGYADFLTTKTNGVRANMAKNFLSPIKHRRNFFLSKDTEVYDIELEDGIEKRAYGVWANIRGHNLLIKAKKEVILTAGPINNAKLLLLSGIGPRKYLMERNIPCCVELPGVGKDLQFRLTVPLFVSFKPSLTCKREAYCENDLINDVYEFIMHRTGDFTHTNVNEFLTLLSTIKKGISLPNIAIQHSYFKIDDRKLEAWIEAMDYDEHIRYKLQRFNRDKTIIMFNVQLLRPQSRAQLFLNDTYHNNNPTIIPNFLSDGQNNDYETLLSGFDFVTFMVSKMKDAGAEFLDLDIPNCRNFKFCTPSYVKCYIRNMATPTNDVIGGAAMGVEEPENNFVVKENLEMISIRGLRIADVSVLGTIPFGNTIGANAMLGFQAAEYLHERWEPEYQSPYMYVPETELTAYE